MNGNNWVGGMKNVQWSGDNDRIQGIKFWMSDINFHLLLIPNSRWFLSPGQNLFKLSRID